MYHPQMSSTVVLVKEGTYASSNVSTLRSENFVHCVAIILRGTIGSLLIHNHPGRTVFPSPKETELRIGKVSRAICVLGPNHMSLGTIHFLATLDLKHVDYYESTEHKFAIEYNHETDLLKTDLHSIPWSTLSTRNFMIDF